MNQTANEQSSESSISMIFVIILVIVLALIVSSFVSIIIVSVNNCKINAIRTSQRQQQQEVRSILLDKPIQNKDKETFMKKIGTHCKLLGDSIRRNSSLGKSENITRNGHETVTIFQLPNEISQDELENHEDLSDSSDKESKQEHLTDSSLKILRSSSFAESAWKEKSLCNENATETPSEIKHESSEMVSQQLEHALPNHDCSVSSNKSVAVNNLKIFSLPPEDIKLDLDNRIAWYHNYQQNVGPSYIPAKDDNLESCDSRTDVRVNLDETALKTTVHGSYVDIASGFKENYFVEESHDPNNEQERRRRIETQLSNISWVQGFWSRNNESFYEVDIQETCRLTQEEARDEISDTTGESRLLFIINQK